MKLIPYYIIDYFQNCNTKTFEKITNQTKYKKPNIPSHLPIF